MSAHPKLSDLTLAADDLARIVAQLMPDDANPGLALEFHRALSKLLEATLSGASVMAAGAVVTLNTKVDKLAEVRGARLREVQLDVDRLSNRVHRLEDEFLDDGTIGELSEAVHQLAVAVEALKSRQVNS